MAKKHIGHDYDRNSRSFNQGAHRYWEGLSFLEKERRLNMDRHFLRMARERRGVAEYEGQVSGIPQG